MVLGKSRRVLGWVCFFSNHRSTPILTIGPFYCLRLIKPPLHLYDRRYRFILTLRHFYDTIALCIDLTRTLRNIYIT